MDTKKRSMHLLLILMALLMPVSLIFQPTQKAMAGNGVGNDLLKILASSDEGISLEFRLPSLPEIRQVSTETGEEFSEVSLPGALLTDKPGEPALPYYAFQLGIPFGVEVMTDIQVESFKTIELTSPVFPAQKPAQGSNLQDTEFNDELLPVQELMSQAEPEFVKNDAIYSSALAYPGQQATILNDGILRTQRIISLGIFPIQYLPEKQELSVAEKIRVRIRFEGEFQPEAQNSINPGPFDATLAANLVNYEDAKAWRSWSAAMNNLDVQSINDNTWEPPDPAWRILTQKEGIHQLTFDQLQAAGFPITGVVPENIKMYTQGEEIAIELIQADPTEFKTGDSIRFYATAIDQKYTNRNVYWLTVGTTAGLRISTWDASPEAAAPVTKFQMTNKFAEKKRFDALIPGDGDIDRFCWGSAERYQASITPLNVTFLLPDYSNGEASIKLTLIGRSQILEVNPDHHYSVSINGNVLNPDLFFDGKKWQEFSLTIPAGVLTRGVNSLRLTPVFEDSYELDSIHFYSIEIEYLADSMATNNRYAFDHGVSQAPFMVTGFSNNSILVYDVADPTEPLKAVNAQIETVGQTFSVTFGDSGNTNGIYRMLTIAELAVPVSIEKDMPSDLLDQTNQADYIIISYKDFVAEAERFAAHKRSLGYSPVVVDVQDVYDQFSYGVLDPYAIKRFLGYAFANWANPKPAYVLLVGDGTRDPKQYLAGSQESNLPPMLVNVDTTIGETPADNRFVQIVGDDLLPEMMIGRVAANSVAEASAVFDKTIGYENNPPEGSWKNRYVAIADDMEPAKNYAGYAEYYITRFVANKNMEISRIYWLDTHFDLGVTRQAIQNSFSNGALLVNYNGHAYYGGWAQEPLFTYRDHLPLVQETDQLPVVLSLACNDGFFVSMKASESAMGEVLTRTPDKGAVAMWAASGFGTLVGHDALAKGFMDSIFNQNELIVGRSVLSGLLTLWATGHNYDQMDNYIYFGDPALRLARSNYSLYLPLVLNP